MNRVSELFKNSIKEKERHTINRCEFKDEILSEFLAYENVLERKDKYKVNILALGDVGSTMLLGLRLLGGDIIEEIGIYDVNKNVMMRYEAEINQIMYPEYEDSKSSNIIDSRNFKMPKVKILSENQLFNCDVFLFCPSVGIAKVGEENEDVRMSQYYGNKKLVENYCKIAIKKKFNGIFGIVSDPVDPLCQSVVLSGLKKEKVKGFGLGVMNGRAMYYSQKYNEFSDYKNSGRVFGPHGKGLVVVNDIENYNEELSNKLTDLVVNANLEVRKIGFKPYIAPAISSGAISVIQFLKGHWNYSSVSFGKAFLGIRNKTVNGKTYFEDLKLDEKIVEKIQNALRELEKLC